MKKYLIYPLFAGATFTMASCEEDFNKEVVAPQSWEQESVINLSGFSATGVTNIDLGTTTTDSITVFSFTQPTGMQEGTTLDNFRINLSKEDSEDVIATIKADNNGKVATADLQSAIETAFGKRPTARTFNAEILANVMINGQASLLSATTNITATPKAPFISTGYYLVGDMFKIDENNNGWNDVCMQAFNHSGKDVYEDPIFSIVFSTTAANQYWKIIPQSNIDNENFLANPGVVGPAINGESALSASLVNESAQAGKIEEEGMYRMTINMMDYTYTLSKLAPEYFILGDEPFGWDVNTKKFMLYPQSTTTHSYTTFFKGNIKMINSNDMGTDNWGACYGTSVDGDTSASADLKQNAGAIHVPEEGYYTLTVDFKESKYTWTKCENQAPTEYTNISLIGDFNSWGGDADLEQIAPHNWFIANFKVENTGGLKFRADHDWPTNWGATLNVADVNYGVGVGNGDNISVPAGTYNVFFNDITGEFVFQSI